MNLIKCSDCDKDVSPSAPSCPHCGKPMKASSGKLEKSEAKKTKSCKHCKAVIDFNVSECPHCHRLLLSRTTGRFIAVGIFAVGIIVVISLSSSMNSGTTSTSSSVPNTSIVGIGQEGYISMPNSSSDVTLLNTQPLLDEYVKAAVAHDIRGMTGILLNGGGFVAKAGTKVLVIDMSGIISRETEVRLLSGDNQGMAGWIPSDWISATAPVVTSDVVDTSNTSSAPKIVKKTISQTDSVTAPTPKPTPVQPTPTAYCSNTSDCAGFNIRIVGDSDGQSMMIYYLTIRGDTVHGTVVTRNLNTGIEQPEMETDSSGESKPMTIYSGLYDTSLRQLSFGYGHWTYPSIMEGLISDDFTGKLTDTTFSGVHSSDDYAVDNNTSKKDVSYMVTYLPISITENIPKKTCLIKGDTYSISGGNATYYPPLSVSYVKVTSPDSWFCSEQDAVGAGYQKALQ